MTVKKTMANVGPLQENKSLQNLCTTLEVPCKLEMANDPEYAGLLYTPYVLTMLPETKEQFAKIYLAIIKREPYENEVWVFENNENFRFRSIAQYTYSPTGELVECYPDHTNIASIYRVMNQT